MKLKVTVENYVNVVLFLHLWFGECQVMQYVTVCILLEMCNNVDLNF
jgi:hypothetical protein